MVQHHRQESYVARTTQLPELVVDHTPQYRLQVTRMTGYELSSKEKRRTPLHLGSRQKLIKFVSAAYLIQPTNWLEKSLVLSLTASSDSMTLRSSDWWVEQFVATPISSSWQCLPSCGYIHIHTYIHTGSEIRPRPPWDSVSKPPSSERR